MSRPPHPARESIFRDLANLNLSPRQIAGKHGASYRLVHNVARRHGVNMRLRAEIIRTIRSIYEMEKELRPKRVEFFSAFPEEFRVQK